MMSYGLKLAAAAIGILVAGIVAILIFENVWARVGLIGAMVILSVGVIGLAWYVDRKDKAKRHGIDELPRV